MNRQLQVGNEDEDPFLAELLLSQVALRIQFFKNENFPLQKETMALIWLYGVA